MQFTSALAALLHKCIVTPQSCGTHHRAIVSSAALLVAACIGIGGTHLLSLMTRELAGLVHALATVVASHATGATFANVSVHCMPSLASLADCALLPRAAVLPSGTALEFSFSTHADALAGSSTIATIIGDVARTLAQRACRGVASGGGSPPGTLRVLRAAQRAATSSAQQSHMASLPARRVAHEHLRSLVASWVALAGPQPMSGASPLAIVASQCSGGDVELARPAVAAVALQWLTIVSASLGASGVDDASDSGWEPLCRDVVTLMDYSIRLPPLRSTFESGHAGANEIGLIVHDCDKRLLRCMLPELLIAARRILLIRLTPSGTVTPPAYLVLIRVALRVIVAGLVANEALTMPIIPLLLPFLPAPALHAHVRAIIAAVALPRPHILAMALRATSPMSSEECLFASVVSQNHNTMPAAGKGATLSSIDHADAPELAPDIVTGTVTHETTIQNVWTPGPGQPDWVCSVCTLRNTEGSRCATCGSSRRVGTQRAPIPGHPPAGDAARLKRGAYRGASGSLRNAKPSSQEQMPSLRRTVPRVDDSRIPLFPVVDAANEKSADAELCDASTPSPPTVAVIVGAADAVAFAVLRYLVGRNCAMLLPVEFEQSVLRHSSDEQEVGAVSLRFAGAHIDDSSEITHESYRSGCVEDIVVSLPPLPSSTWRALISRCAAAVNFDDSLVELATTDAALHVVGVALNGVAAHTTLARLFRRSFNRLAHTGSTAVANAIERYCATIGLVSTVARPSLWPFIQFDVDAVVALPQVAVWELASVLKICEGCLTIEALMREGGGLRGTLTLLLGSLCQTPASPASTAKSNGYGSARGRLQLQLQVQRIAVCALPLLLRGIRTAATVEPAVHVDSSSSSRTLQPPGNTDPFDELFRSISRCCGVSTDGGADVFDAVRCAFLPFSGNVMVVQENIISCISDALCSVFTVFLDAASDAAFETTRAELVAAIPPGTDRPTRRTLAAPASSASSRAVGEDSPSSPVTAVGRLLRRLHDSLRDLNQFPKRSIK